MPHPHATRPPRATDHVHLGTDSSGRPIVLTVRMQAAFEAVVAQLDFRPVIIQGAFMATNGLAAVASGGTHDRAGCLDTRTEHLTVTEQQKVVRAARRVGWALWKRDLRHGHMEQHHHWVLIGEPDMAPAARQQVRAYRAGRNGLRDGGPDYHWRPDPIPVFHYHPPRPGRVGD